MSRAPTRLPRAARLLPLLLPLLLVTTVSTARAQQVEQEVGLLTEVTETSVWLRWTLPDSELPDSVFVIERANAAGEVRRFTLPAPMPRAEAVRRGLVDDEEYAEIVATFTADETLTAEERERRALDRAMLTLMTVTRASFAEVLGTLFEDTTATSGTSYTYRVTTTVDGEPVTIGEDDVTAGDVAPLPEVGGLAADVDAGGVHLRWELPEEGFIVGYKVYRTDPDGVEHDLAPQGLFVSRQEDQDTGELRLPDVFLRDSAVVANSAYEYTVAGMNVFGRETPRSEPLRVLFPDPVPLAVPLVTSVDVRDQAIELLWTAPDDDRVVGIGVLRYLDPQGEPTLLTPDMLPASAASFTDTQVTGGVSYYYSLVTVDQHGRRFGPSPPRAARAVNLTPPSAPSDLALTATETGLDLRWDAPPETDIAGYQVMILRDDRQVLVTDELVAGTTYTLDVPAGTLDEFRVAVRAVNTSFVEGPLSDPVSGRVIDVVPPDRPILSGIRAGDGEVSVTWAHTTDPDVATYRVLRQVQGEEEFLVLREDLVPRDTAYADSAVTPGLLHVYTVEAVDASGNVSEPASPLSATPYRFTAPDAPRGVEARLLEDGGVEVSWEAPATPGIVLYVVERDVSGGRFAQVSDPLLARSTSWTDPGGRPGVSYRVFAIDGSGNPSQPSEAALVVE